MDFCDKLEYLSKTGSMPIPLTYSSARKREKTGRERTEREKAGKRRKGRRKNDGHT